MVKNMKKNSIKKMALFSFIFSVLLISSILPTTKIVAVTPEEIFDTEFDTQVEALMDIAWVESLALSVINGTEVFYETGYGEQPGTDIVYYINAVSCIVAATALLQLMDDGLFDLSDQINNYLPWILRNPYFPDTPITIYDVLAERTTLLYSDEIHQAIYVDEVPWPDFFYETLNENGSYYTIDSWANREPGIEYEHHWLDWDLAAYLVELISGEPYAQYVEKNIFTPLGMTNTEFTYTNFTLNQLAKQYIWNATSEVNEEQPFWDDPGIGSAGVLSTVGDLSKFLIAHMNKGVYNSIRILEEATVELMHTTVASNYGLFWGNKLVDDSYHGFVSWPWIGAAAMVTKANLGLVVFVNQGFLDFMDDMAGIVDLYRRLNDVYDYIAAKAKELIPPRPTTDETRFGLITLPLMLVILGTVSIYNKKRNK